MPLAPQPLLADAALFAGGTLAQAGSYAIIGLLIGVLVLIVIGIIVAGHVIGPRRHGPIKDSTYESGVDPIGDARKRFNVRFYIVAMLFLLFDVEIVFFYPWGVLFPRLSAADGTEQAASVAPMVEAGYATGFLLVEMFIFVAILLVGYVYAWRKGAFQWN